MPAVIRQIDFFTVNCGDFLSLSWVQWFPVAVVGVVEVKGGQRPLWDDTRYDKMGFSKLPEGVNVGEITSSSAAG